MQMQLNHIFEHILTGKKKDSNIGRMSFNSCNTSYWYMTVIGCIICTDGSTKVIGI